MDPELSLSLLLATKKQHRGELAGHPRGAAPLGLLFQKKQDLAVVWRGGSRQKKKKKMIWRIYDTTAVTHCIEVVSAEPNCRGSPQGNRKVEQE